MKTKTKRLAATTAWPEGVTRELVAGYLAATNLGVFEARFEEKHRGDLVRAIRAMRACYDQARAALGSEGLDITDEYQSWYDELGKPKEVAYWRKTLNKEFGI